MKAEILQGKWQIREPGTFLRIPSNVNGLVPETLRAGA